MPTCGFCKDLRPDVEKGHLVKFESNNILAHTKCLQFSANLFQDENASWDSQLVAKELKRISFLACFVCKSGKRKATGGAGSGCAFAKCKLSFHFPCVPIVSKCRNDEDEDMYLAFCSVECESQYFSAKPEVTPLDGRRELRETNAAVVAKKQAASAKKRVRTKTDDLSELDVTLDNAGAGMDSNIDYGSGAADAAGNSAGLSTLTVNGHGPTSLNFGGNAGSSTGRAATGSSSSDNTHSSGSSSASSGDDTVERKKQPKASSEENPTPAKQARSAPSSNSAPHAANSANGADRSPGLQQAAPPEQAASPVLSSKPVAANAANGVDRSPDLQQAAPAERAASPGLESMEAAPPTPPYADNEQEPDDGARAVCVRIRDRSFKVQTIGGFIFPSDVMDGPPMTEANFFPPQRESTDLFKVVGELTGDKYRLIESPAHFGHGVSGNRVFDSLLRHLRNNAAESGVDGAFDLYVVHPRPQREYFRFVLEESFTSLCENLVRTMREAPGQENSSSALFLFPLFLEGKALIQPLYNGIIIPKALSYGLAVNCLNGARREECAASRLEDSRAFKWPSCVLIQVLPKGY